MTKIRKLIGAVLGGVTAGAILGIARLAGAELEPELAAAIVTVLAALGTYVAPANETARQVRPR